jgi:hypothetical protein
MLCQIPQVSNSIASILVEKYDNMNQFISELNKHSNNDTEKMMLSIANEKHGSNNKKVGDKIALKIIQNMFNCTIEIKKKEPKKRGKKESVKVNKKKDEKEEETHEEIIKTENKTLSMFSD